MPFLEIQCLISTWDVHYLSRHLGVCLQIQCAPLITQFAIDLSKSLMYFCCDHKEPSRLAGRQWGRWPNCIRWEGKNFTDSSYTTPNRNSQGCYQWKFDLLNHNNLTPKWAGSIGLVHCYDFWCQLYHSSTFNKKGCVNPTDSNFTWA